MGSIKRPDTGPEDASGSPIIATRAATVRVTSHDMVLGAPEAPVTLIWYASPTSHHCAQWYNAVFPQVRRRYIETGRVRLVLLEFLTAHAAVGEDCFLVCRGAGPSRYFRVMGSLFERHEALMACDNLYNHREALWTIAAAHGVSRSIFAKVLSDLPAREALRARVYAHTRGDRVNGAPSFIVGNRFFDGYAPIGVLTAAIKEAERP